MARKITVAEALALMNAAILDAWSPENIAALAREILTKVDRETAVQLFHPGTVVADTWNGLLHTVTLHMDGPPDQVAVETYGYVLIPQILFPGQRVMVWYDKPHVAYVIGTVTLPVPPGGRLSNCDITDPLSFADNTILDIDFTCAEELTSGVTATAGVFAVPIDGLYSANFNGTWTFFATPDPSAYVTRIQDDSPTSGFAQMGYVTQLFASGPMQLAAHRLALRAGSHVWANVQTVGTDSAGQLYNTFLELSFLGPFVNQAGCQCSGG